MKSFKLAAVSKLLAAAFYQPHSVTASVTERKIMKQLYKIITVLLCILLFASCHGNTADVSQGKTDDPQISVGENSSQTESSAKERTVNGEAEKEPVLHKRFTQLASAKEDNSDTVAWLRIPSTDIDNPVMQTANNEDYLQKNENGRYDIWGCYFADYYSVLIDRSSLKQNTVIYGHSESTEKTDGKRFTQLFKYLDIDFLRKNPNIYLTIGEETLMFEVFAVFFTDTNFYYIDPNPSDQGFENFKKTIAEKNEFFFYSNLSEQDKLLTLSACAYRYDTEKTGDHRLVVMAKLMPEGAVPQAVAVTANPNPQRP